MASNRRFASSIYSLNSCEALTAAIASSSQAVQNQCSLGVFLVITSYSVTVSLVQVRQLHWAGHLERFHSNIFTSTEDTETSCFHLINTVFSSFAKI